MSKTVEERLELLEHHARYKQAFGAVIEGDLKKIVQTIKDLDQRTERGFGEVDQRFGRVEQRLGRVEHRLDSVDQRLDSVDQRLDSVDQRLESVDQRLESVDQRLEAMDRRFGGMEEKMDLVLALMGAAPEGDDTAG